MLVAAVAADDPFATGVLSAALRHLASAVTAVYTAIGVRRYLIIGGFALAVGEPFARLLTEQLIDLGCFGLDDDQIRRMVSVGRADDDHGLLGIGRMVQATLT